MFIVSLTSIHHSFTIDDWNQTLRLTFCCRLIPELTNTRSFARLGRLSLGKIEVSQCLGSVVAAPLGLKSLSWACPSGVR